MFNAKKDLEALREGTHSLLEQLKQDFSSKLEENKNAIRELYKLINELKENTLSHNETIKKDLLEINTLRSEFERALNRINSISSSIEDTAADRVREVAETHISSIQQSSSNYKELEQELKAIVAKIHTLQLEISKFVSISQQINLVDFSLKKHKDDLSNYEKEKNELINENERLKSIMAKMKRRSI